MRDYFGTIADHLGALLRGNEVYLASFGGEESDFVRFNKSQIRQAGHVAQRGLSIDLVSGRRHASGSVALSGDLESDRGRLSRLMADLRQMRDALPEDPHLLYSTEVRSSERALPDRLPEPDSAVEEIRTAGRGRDLVGIYAAGTIHAGFANSLGQRNWHSGASFNLDWSFYHAADKAVKTGYAGFEWNPHEFGRKVAFAAEQLDVLKHPPRTIPPGRYRVYLSPVAVNDLFGLVAWGGFGLKAHRTKQTPLLRMAQEGARLNTAVSLIENTRDGVAPNFQEAGFVRPDAVTLIEKGAFRDCLVSPRSAREFGVPTNGASANEAPQSVEMAAGALPVGDVVRRLDTGVYIGNIWYLNFSDRSACRTTGMTRFATFWVEGGRIVAPLNVMRFDETIYRALGENLAGLTAEREMLLDAGTYGARSTCSGRMPGALVNEFTFTL